MKQAMRYLRTVVAGAICSLGCALAGGCFSGHLTTDNQVEVKPIHITIDVNVHVEKDLDNYFNSTQPDSHDVVKKRLQDRKPAVEQLLAGKAVGENNGGFLEAIGSLADADAKTVGAENADRATIYAAIAAKNGTDVAKVGQLRAVKLAARAKPGAMLQGRDGKWEEKK